MSSATKNPNNKDFSKRAFQEHLNAKKLMGTRCKGCGALFLPPRPMCTECFRDQMAWEAVNGAGVLTAYTTIHIAPTAMIEAGYGRDKPYCSGIVKLDAGPAISVQILGVDAADPTSIKIGMRLEAEFTERGEKIFLAFRAA